jgi:NAD(P)-dependent dehydrogenase (short-subunit alcohol dehydrogenase family)
LDEHRTHASGRRALVTGASGGIGQAIAERLARDGAHVIVHANTRLDAAQAIAGAIVAAGGSAEAIAFDVTDRDAARAACERLAAAARSRSSSTTPACTTTRSFRRCASAVAARHRRLAERLLHTSPSRW